MIILPAEWPRFVDVPRSDGVKRRPGAEVRGLQTGQSNPPKEEQS